MNHCLIIMKHQNVGGSKPFRVLDYSLEVLSFKPVLEIGTRVGRLCVQGTTEIVESINERVGPKLFKGPNIKINKVLGKIGKLDLLEEMVN